MYDVNLSPEFPLAVLFKREGGGGELVHPLPLHFFLVARLGCLLTGTV